MAHFGYKNKVQHRVYCLNLFGGLLFCNPAAPLGVKGRRGGAGCLKCFILWSKKSLSASSELLKQREGGLVYRCEAEEQSMNYKCSAVSGR